MGDSSRRVPARRLRSNRLVPGVVYEWTPGGDEPMDPVIDPEVVAKPPGLTSLRAGAQVIAGYRLVERIGEGCTGEVWRATGPGGVAVALKFIRTGRHGAAQELRSLELMFDVRHANLVTIFGIWERDDWTAIGMDLADGSLLDRFEAAFAAGRPGLDFAELTHLLRQAAWGIDFLNEPRPTPLGFESEALAHRDIKPQNLLLVGGSVKVGDFGLVKPLTDDPGLSPWPEPEGIESLVTAYTSPEVRRGGLSSRSDQYSLAATYCQLRGGRVPGTSITALRSARQPAFDDCAELALLPSSERSTVARALATDPEQRWPSCTAFVEALIASAREEGPSPSAPVACPPAKRSRRVALAVLLMVSTLAAFALSWSGKSFPPLGAMAAHPDPVAVPAQSSLPSRQTKPESLVEETSIAGRLDSVEVSFPTSKVKTDSVVETASIVAVPSLDPPLLEPIIPAPTNSVAVPFADTLDNLVTIEALPVGTKEGTGLSGAEIQSGVKAWWDLTWGRFEARLIAARNAVEAWVEALPDLAPTPVPPIPVSPVSPAAQIATIVVRMPSSNAELIVRGEVGQGNAGEWSGPRRVVHSPPMTAARDYLIGTLWTDSLGRKMSRAQPLKVEPGGIYEVDLQSNNPTAAAVPRTSPPNPSASKPSTADAPKPVNEVNSKNRRGLLNRLPLPHFKPSERRGSRVR